jgi:2-polyprenyl-3-methyl-5-hydroxy-6-metoxy-1,4-benzoquinol methylase
MKTDHEAHILQAWHANARPWAAVVRDGNIESRRVVTNAAVIDTVCAQAPNTVIDLGCGEGWLVRALASRGIAVLGVDAVPELIELARSQPGGRYHCLDYQAIARGELAETADVVVCNFSLLGETSVVDLIHVVPTLLNRDGVLVIQTLHPHAACGDAPYEDGWRAGTWAGIEGDFSPAPPWYFRTEESWVQLIHGAGLTLRQTLAPCWPGTARPASLLLVAQRAG